MLHGNFKDYVADNGGRNYSKRYKNLDKHVKRLEVEISSKLDGLSYALSSSSSNSKASPSSILESYETRYGSRRGKGGSRHGIDVPDSRGGKTWHLEAYSPGFVLPPVNTIRGSDRFPGPGAGIYPTRVGFDNDESMLLGPNDRRWSDLSITDVGSSERQSAVPPSARFDHYGPPGVPGNRGRPDRGGVQPDLEHFGGDTGFM